MKTSKRKMKRIWKAPTLEANKTYKNPRKVFIKQNYEKTTTTKIK